MLWLSIITLFLPFQKNEAVHVPSAISITLLVGPQNGAPGAFAPIPAKGISFADCPTSTPPTVLRVNVQIKHTPEQGFLCQPCLNPGNETGMAQVSVRINVGGATGTLNIAGPGWNCGAVPDPNGIVYNQNIDIPIECMKMQPPNATKCEIVVNGTRTGKHKTRAKVCVDIEWCRKQNNVCKRGEFRNNACTVNWNNRPVYTTKQHKINIECP